MSRLVARPSSAARVASTDLVTYASLGAIALACAAASVVMAGGVRGSLGAGLALLMLIIAAVDARRFIIPDELTLAALALALVQAAILDPNPATAILQAVLRALALGLIFFAIRETYVRLRGRDGLGLGDVKLAAVAGAWLGWTAIPIAVEVAALSALALYLVRYLSGRPLRATQRIPFGLFLAPAIWIAWMFEAWIETL
jgi:leader peptidase (prepilin peptidase)/N-methyltransferase